MTSGAAIESSRPPRRAAERQALPLLADDLAQNIVEVLAEGAW